MRPRVPAAAQSLSYIWISDDILADAYNRFVRVSRVCSRRHASNTPGPLEAQRRLARRRMGVAAAAASSGPPMPDLGALFGLGSRPPVSTEKSLTWHAPSLHAPSDTGDSSTSTYGSIGPWHWHKPRRKQQDWDQLLRLPEEVDNTTQTPVANPVGTSKAAFKRLLTSRTAGSDLGAEHLAPMLAFLQSSADESEANNFTALLEYLSRYNLEGDAHRSLLSFLDDRLSLGTLEVKQLVPAVYLLVRQGLTSNIQEGLTGLLDKLPDETAAQTICKTTEHLSRRLVGARAPIQLEHMSFWLEALRASQCMQGRHYDHKIWPAVYDQLARLFDITQLASHFACLDRLDFAELILRHWVPHIARDETAPAVLALEGSRTIRLRQPHKQLQLDLPRMIAHFEALCRTRPSNGQYSSAPNIRADHVFGHLTTVLSKNNIPYATLLELMFEVFKTNDPPYVVYGTFMSIVQQPSSGVPTQLALDLILWFLDRGDKSDLRSAWRIFRAVPSVPILHCLDLPLKLLEHGYVKPERLFYILNRKTAADIEPAEFRTKPNLSLVPQHIEMVNLTAFGWASQESLHPRVAYRRVWETYRFLRDRGGTVSVLMSRALVKAGIIRPLQSGEFVPYARRQYILSLVRDCEGDAVAESIDRLVFNTFKARRLGGNPAAWASKPWAGRSDETILRTTRWRMRHWTKQPTSPLFDSNGLVPGTETKRTRERARRIRDPAEDSHLGPEADEPSQTTTEDTPSSHGVGHVLDSGADTLDDFFWAGKSGGTAELDAVKHDRAENAPSTEELWLPEYDAFK